MKLKLLLIAIVSFYMNNAFSQQEQCGTMKNLEEKIKKDPSIKTRMLQVEQQNKEWIEKNGLGFKKHPEIESKNNSNNSSKSTINTFDLCGYNNNLYTAIPAPTILNQIVSPSSNCTYGGEFVRVYDLIAEKTYRISTIGANNFDTQITIYPEGGGDAVGFNDDWGASLQSEIYFTPILSGSYDVLINEYGCSNNQLCASLEVELWGNPRAVITIPVVVHVIHSGEAIGTGTNISDAQIQSQIDVLNEDFRRLNPDISLVPAAFRGVSADPLIQFCLAQQDPDGFLTNGITRYIQPTQEEYNQLGIAAELQCLNMPTIETIIKPETIWNRDKYLNLWVSDMKQLPPTLNGQPNTAVGNNQGCNFQASLLGYAQFPGEIATIDNPNPELTDGVWIKYDVFGKIGNLVPAYNLGRTATHEVGHWLNLKHIWGDENACAADDEVIDTPKQTVSTSGCKVFPSYDTCTTNYPGIMFKNYMDYSDDNCVGLFTYGQFARMDAVLFNQRIGLLTSQGCVPGTLAINGFESKKINISPNPTSSKVFFDNSSYNFNEVVIYNYLGQEVAKASFTAIINNQEIDMINLSAGVYLLKFSNGKNSTTVKVVKQ
ncbi:MAG: T9SS type A sorting domain-containing protein [Flavobacterium sp.]|nr:T9SS type A sorting domain-containing protein [Flavobacterium sp.]